MSEKVYANIWRRRDGTQFLGIPFTENRSWLDGRTLVGESSTRRVGVLHIRKKPDAALAGSDG